MEFHVSKWRTVFGVLCCFLPVFKEGNILNYQQQCDMLRSMDTDTNTSMKHDNFQKNQDTDKYTVKKKDIFYIFFMIINIASVNKNSKLMRTNNNYLITR